jgi:hypothetical protein
MGAKLVSHSMGKEFRMFENRVLKRKFGPKRKKVAGKWSEMYND